MTKPLPLVIGISGKARTGKDTAGNLLVENFNYTLISFAEPIRKFVAGLLGITVEAMDPIKEIPQPILGNKTPRYAMQTLGTEWGRDMISGSLWVDVCMAKAQRIIDAGGRAVITDVRFINEALAVRDTGGPLIALDRKVASITDNPDHISEVGLDPELMNAFIQNDGSIHELWLNIKNIVQID